MYAAEWTEGDDEDDVFDLVLPHPFDRLVKEPVCFEAGNGEVLTYLTKLIQTSMEDQPVQYVPIDLYRGNRRGEEEEEGAEVEEEIENEGEEEEAEEDDEEVEGEEEEEYEETDEDFELEQE